MKKRNPIAVFLLPLITFGIYSLYWFVKTKGEMNSLGAKIPTAWLIIIPLVNIWWMWKYCEGVEQVTGAKLNGVLAFILILLLGSIGSAIIQDSFNNNVSATPAAAAAAAPTAPIAQSPETSAAESAPATESSLPEAPVDATPAGTTEPTPPANPPTTLVQ